jgi:hypothetical protein
MEETQEAVEYQREIDELLAGGLTDEDEDAVMDELNAIIMVCFATGDCCSQCLFFAHLFLKEQAPTVPEKEPEQADLEFPEVPAEKAKGISLCDHSQICGIFKTCFSYLFRERTSKRGDASVIIIHLVNSLFTASSFHHSFSIFYQINERI